MKRSDNNKGMTLIEVIIAMAVLSIVVLIMLTVYSSVMTVMGGSRQQTDANYQDQAQVEATIAGGTSTTSSALTFTFTGGGSTVDVTVDGEIVNEGEITVFIPAND